jgi:hypothetical protein
MGLECVSYLRPCLSGKIGKRKKVQNKTNVKHSRNVPPKTMSDISKSEKGECRIAKGHLILYSFAPIIRIKQIRETWIGLFQTSMDALSLLMALTYQY